MKNTLVIATILFVLAPVAAAEKAADQHIASIREIGRILAEYTQKKGVTPYSENWKDDDPNDENVPVPIICNLSVNNIPEKLAFPPFSCSLFDHEQVEQYLSEGLGREIKLPLDVRSLRQDGRTMPLFYTIQIQEDKFFVATYLTDPHKDARKLGKRWYKFEVGSVAVPEKKIEKAVAPKQTVDKK